jgi:ankyrin repeat protein
LDYRADLELRDGDQRTALYWAAARHRVDCATLLVAAGADLETADAEGETPLLVAVSSGTRVAKFLMKQGANIHAKNLNGDDIFALSQNYADELHPIIREHGGRE